MSDWLEDLIDDYIILSHQNCDDGCSCCGEIEGRTGLADAIRAEMEKRMPEKKIIHSPSVITRDIYAHDKGYNYAITDVQEALGLTKE